MPERGGHRGDAKNRGGADARRTAAPAGAGRRPDQVARGHAGRCRKGGGRPAGKAVRLKGEALKEERKIRRRMRMRGSWNHSSPEATGRAKNRRKFRREAGRYRAKEGGRIRTPLRRRGARAPARGVAPRQAGRRPKVACGRHVRAVRPDRSRAAQQDAEADPRDRRVGPGAANLPMPHNARHVPRLRHRGLPHAGGHPRKPRLAQTAGATPYSDKAGRRSAMEAGDNFVDAHRRKPSNGAMPNCTRATAADVRGM